MSKKITVITGGGGGMGRAIARKLGKRTTVVLSGRTEARLQAAKEELDYLGIESHIVVADCDKFDEIQALAEFADSLGDVTYVMNTAGIDPSDHLASDVVHADAGALINVMKAFYPIICEGGVYINWSSIASMHGPGELEQYYDGNKEIYDLWEDHPVYQHWADEDFCDQLYAAIRECWPDFEEDGYLLAGVSYNVCKRFTNVFTRQNTVRFAKKGCRILSILPGVYATPMHQGLMAARSEEFIKNELNLIPLKRWGRAYEMGELIDYLCSDEAAYITGFNILADGGTMAHDKIPQIR